MELLTKSYVIWKKVNTECNHKIRSVFASDSSLTGNAVFSACKCRAGIIFN